MERETTTFLNNELTSLFLKQSITDTKSDYGFSCSDKEFPHWDCIVLTASNDLQAEGYRKQIDLRKNNGILPCNTDFFVVPDKDNCRVGSAGSTLMVIRLLRNKYADFYNKKILVIHAGGNSSRTPQYSALGKIFSPIPTMVGNNLATIFDMFLITMASIPGRISNGMLLLSGDVTLLFNPLMCDFGSSDAAVISFKEDVETAKNHGVFLKSHTGNVANFLHKQSVENLKKNGAVDKRNNCNIDTGAIWFSPKILEKLYELVESDESYNSIVNSKVRLSLYGDIAYCLAENSNLNDFYNEKPENEFCDELTEARTKLWSLIGQYNMKLLSVSPSRFIHFGSIPEIMNLMNHGVCEYNYLGWNKKTNCSITNDEVSGYNSVLSSRASIGKGTYLEESYIHSNAVIGSGCYISFSDIHDEAVPDNTFVHSLKQRNGKFVCRIMNVSDNPKENSIFGIPLEEIVEKNNFQNNELWENNEPHTLWNARIFPECDTVDAAIKSSLKLYDLFINGKGNLEEWRSSVRKSFCSGFEDADPQAIIDWNKRMSDLVYMNYIKHSIKSNVDLCECLKPNGVSLSKIQKQWLQNELKCLNMNYVDDFSYALRLYFYVGSLFDNKTYISRSFEMISESVLQSALSNLKYNKNCRIVKNETIVRLPLRINWGGGWTDTCPYCIENGGTVINAAILLNDSLPVEIRIVKTEKKKIIFDSRDLGEYREFDDIKELQKVGDPFDPFALQKACLIACGVIPSKGGNLSGILTRLGGGFTICTEVKDVPKGSGLGTSSILSAASVKAVFDFVDIKYDNEMLYSTVLAMEQIMSTGGGWQDQVGGLTSGIKFITSKKGIKQKVNVEYVNISEKTKKELSDRFVIIYTGQRRLARNILRNVIGRYVGNNPESVKAHSGIRQIAVLMKYALEQGDVDEFAKLLNEHWNYSKMIDEDSSNMLIEQILASISDLIDAKMICGAGGGGFLQVILKKNVSKDDVQKRLKDVFMDFPIDVWSSELYFG